MRWKCECFWLYLEWSVTKIKLKMKSLDFPYITYPTIWELSNYNCLFNVQLSAQRNSFFFFNKKHKKPSMKRFTVTTQNSNHRHIVVHYRITSKNRVHDFQSNGLTVIIQSIILIFIAFAILHTLLRGIIFLLRLIINGCKNILLASIKKILINDSRSNERESSQNIQWINAQRTINLKQ